MSGIDENEIYSYPGALAQELSDNFSTKKDEPSNNATDSGSTVKQKLLNSAISTLGSLTPFGSDIGRLSKRVVQELPDAASSFSNHVTRNAKAAVSAVQTFADDARKLADDPHVKETISNAMPLVESISRGIESLDELPSNVADKAKKFGQAAAPFARIVKGISVIGDARKAYKAYRGGRYLETVGHLGNIGFTLAKNPILLPMAIDAEKTFSGEKEALDEFGQRLGEDEGHNAFFMPPSKLEMTRQNGAIRSTPAPVRAIRDAALFNPSDFTVPQAPYQVME